MKRILTPLVALSALALFAGCPDFAPEHGEGMTELRCDAIGCQLCDGFYCQEYACNVVDQCPSSYRCEAARCVLGSGSGPIGGPTLECTSSAQCAPGLLCTKNGVCVDPSSGEPPVTEPTEPPLDTCKLDAECPAGQECIEGSCQAKSFTLRPEGTCNFNYDCGPEGVCVNQGCYFPPTAGVCPKGGAVHGGLCLPTQAGAGECQLGAECGAGALCIDTTCYSTCAIDDDCGSGAVCGGQSLCVLDTRPIMQCLATGDCASGSCVEGRCLAKCDVTAELVCEGHMECAYGYCMQVPTCTEKTDCSEAKDCVNGECADLGAVVPPADAPVDDPPADDPPADDPPADDPPADDPPSDDPPADDPPADDPPEEHTD